MQAACMTKAIKCGSANRRSELRCRKQNETCSGPSEKQHKLVYKQLLHQTMANRLEKSLGGSTFAFQQNPVRVVPQDDHHTEIRCQKCVRMNPEVPQRAQRAIFAIFQFLFFRSFAPGGAGMVPCASAWSGQRLKNPIYQNAANFEVAAEVNRCQRANALTLKMRRKQTMHVTVVAFAVKV